MTTTPKQAEKTLLEERGILATLEADLVGLKERHHELSREVDAERRGRSDPDRLTTLAGRLASLELLLRDQEADVEAATRRVEAAEAALRDAVESSEHQAKIAARDKAYDDLKTITDDALDKAFRELARAVEAAKVARSAQFALTGRHRDTSGTRDERYLATRALARTSGGLHDALETLLEHAPGLAAKTCEQRRHERDEHKRKTDEENRAITARLRLQELDDLDAFLRARGRSEAHERRAVEILQELQRLGHPYQAELPPGVHERLAQHEEATA